MKKYAILSENKRGFYTNYQGKFYFPDRRCQPLSKGIIEITEYNEKDNYGFFIGHNLITDSAEKILSMLIEIPDVSLISEVYNYYGNYMCKLYDKIYTSINNELIEIKFFDYLFENEKGCEPVRYLSKNILDYVDTRSDDYVIETCLRNLILFSKVVTYSYRNKVLITTDKRYKSQDIYLIVENYNIIKIPQILNVDVDCSKNITKKLDEMCKIYHITQSPLQSNSIEIKSGVTSTIIPVTSIYYEDLENLNRPIFNERSNEVIYKIKNENKIITKKYEELFSNSNEITPIDKSVIYSFGIN